MSGIKSSWLKHKTTFELDHAGDCQIVGLDDAGNIFVEEIYGDDDLLAQYQLSMSGARVKTVDEGDCAEGESVSLTLPHDIERPSRAREFQHLDFAGARRRGLAASERVDEITRRLTMMEKTDLVDYLELDIDPGRVIGMAESRIISACRIDSAHWIVCRRIRAAYRLPKLRADSRGRAYDYDSIPICLLHPLADLAQELPDLETCLRWTLDADLYRPQDCMTWRGKLIVADGGDEDVPSALHIFDLNLPALDLPKGANLPATI